MRFGSFFCKCVQHNCLACAISSMFSASPALAIRVRASPSISCLIGALAAHATNAKYLKIILNSSIVFVFEMVVFLDFRRLCTKASNLSSTCSHPRGIEKDDLLDKYL